MPQKIIKPKLEFLEKMNLLLKDPREFGRYKKIIQEPLQNSIRCNALKISPEELKKRLENKGWKIKQPWKNYPEVMIVEGKYVRQGSQINMASDLASPKSFANKIVDGGENFREDIVNGDIKNRIEDYGLNNIKARSIAKPISSQQSSSVQARDNFIELQPGELGRSLEHLLGYYYIQEIASMLSVIALRPQQNETLLDIAAAPGSKTTQIAAQMENKGTIIANDINIQRIKILSSNLERCGVSNTIIIRDDGIKLCERLKNQEMIFDKILLDAPCSGEGTIRSSPKTALMWNPNTISSLSKLQKKFIKGAIEILKQGGELIYSTCTHAPEENEAVVDFALKEFKDKIKIEKPILPREIKFREGIIKWKEEEYDERVKLCARIYPQDNDSEGFFIAKLRKIK